MYKKCVEVAE